MPEGDTLFRSARTLKKVLQGQVIQRFSSSVAQLARQQDEAPVTGRIVEDVWAKGKWLVIQFSGDLYLLTHMLMKGSWHIYRIGEPWRYKYDAMRIAMETNEWQVVAFNVQTAQFHSKKTLSRQHGYAGLGPDLLGQTFDSQEGKRRILKNPSESIGVAIMRQSLIAGIGNVYRSEVCFMCGINPFRQVSTITNAEMDSLMATAQKVMRENIRQTAESGIVTYHPLRTTTSKSQEGERHWVYARKGHPCRKCGAIIERYKIGDEARTVYWCPVCQPSA